MDWSQFPWRDCDSFSSGNLSDDTEFLAAIIRARRRDAAFLDDLWTTRRGPKPEGVKAAPVLRASLRVCFELVDELKKRIENRKDDDEMDEADTEMSRELANKIAELKKDLMIVDKRRFGRRKRRRLASSKTRLKPSVDADAVHDAWREELEAKARTAKAEKEVVALADGVLCETRRKTSEMKSLEGIIHRLKTLRQVRLASQNYQTAFELCSDQDTDRFERLTTVSLDLIQAQLKSYAAEEVTLRIMAGIETQGT